MHSLGQTLGQRQSLAPRLQQSSAILQMTATELTALVQGELDSDPFLEPAPDREPPFPSGPSNKGANAPDPVDSVVQEISLRTRLMAQLPHLPLSAARQAIAIFLIGMLDDKGYLRETDETLAQMLQVQCLDIAIVRQHLRNLDPSGLFCTGLIEFLRFQLGDPGPVDPVCFRLLDFLSDRGFSPTPDMATALSISTAQVETCLSVIRKLRAHPPADTENAPAPPIQPDILVTGSVAQGWKVDLNEDILPRVLLNSSYYNDLKDEMRTGEQLDFVTDRFGRARWLLRCIAQRSLTLRRVAGVCVQHQGVFLDGQSSELAPLTLRDIATELDLHPSTISRATSGKFLAVPGGTIPMKTLLTRAVGKARDGKGLSSRKIKSFIEEAVRMENKDIPHTDDMVCRLLAQKGIKIARRTVAKYRGQMNIPSTRSRRAETGTST